MVSPRPNVDLFEKIEEGVDFAEAGNITIQGVKVFNTTYLLILITGGMEKSCGVGIYASCPKELTGLK